MRIGLIPQLIVNARHPRGSEPFVPLGLLALAGALDRSRHAVEILDLTREVASGALPYDARFEEAAARLILARAWDLVGFSTFSAAYHHTLGMVRVLRRLRPDLVIVLGGPQASVCDRETLEDFPVDFVVRGEAERSFPELLEALEQARAPEGILGLSRRAGGRCLREAERPLIEDLDSLPFPAFDLYPLRGHPKAPVEVTRGCPYACVYCATANYWRRKVRRKSAVRVHAEMTRLVEGYGVTGISMADDTFTVDRRRALEVCAHLVREGFSTRWLCSTRIDAVDAELLAAMARAGCRNIFYGIESGSPRVQRQIRKNIDLDVVIANLGATAAAGIDATVSFMMGFPEETAADLRQTLALRCRIQRIFPSKQAVQVHILAPDTNTAITEAHKQDLRFDGYLPDQAGGGMLGFDRETITRHAALFVSSHYIESRHLSREFIKLTHAFLAAAQLLCYWSALYLMLEGGDPLRLVKAWLTFHAEADTEAPGEPLSHERIVGRAARFFARRFAGEDVPGAIRELYRHELELARSEGARMLARGGGDVSGPPRELRLEWDPRATIEAIRRDPACVPTLPRRPTTVRYVS
jgi:hypothetical protein